MCCTMGATEYTELAQSGSQWKTLTGKMKSSSVAVKRDKNDSRHQESAQNGRCLLSCAFRPRRIPGTIV